MTGKRLFALLMCVVVMIGLLVGCGSSSNEAYDSAAEVQSADGSSGVTSSTSLGTYTDPNAKLIRTVYLDAQTKDYDSLMAGLEEKIAALEGYVESRDAYNGSEYYNYTNRWCSMVIRIPSDRLDEFVTHVTENCSVTSTSETVENVTLEYADTEARVQALETEQARLLELLEAAQNLEEILQIEDRLSDVRYELSSYASQLKVLENQVSYATVHLNIDEVEKLTVAEPTVWERIRDGFSETISDIADGAVDLFVWIVVNSPMILILAAVITVVVIIYRKIRPKRRKKQKTEPPKSQDAE